MIIETFTGRMVDIEKMGVEDVCIEDIAHALAMTCRFNGHCKEFYSVAQHSVLVMENIGDKVSQELKMAALLHDAAEAYIGDIITPIKTKLPIISNIERRILRVICIRFGISELFSQGCQEINTTDHRMIATEKRDLMVPAVWTNFQYVEPFDWAIHPVSQVIAERMFLNRFDTTGGKRNTTTEVKG